MNRKELKEKRSDLVNKLDSVSTAEELEAVKKELNDVNAKIEAKDMMEKMKSSDAGESKSIAKEVGNFKDVVASLVSNKPNEALYNLSQDARREGANNGVTYQNERSIVLSNKQLGAILNATLTTATGTNGGGNALETIETGYIDALRDRLTLTSLGAEFMDNLVGNIDYTAELNTAVAAWDAETDTISDTSSTFEKRKLTPKRLAVYLPVSNQWLQQSSTTYARFLENQLLRSVAEKIEAAAIAGTGSNDQPTGILSAGATELFAGAAATDSTNANGAALVYDDIVALEKAIAVNNADVNGLSFLTNAKVRAALKKTAVESGDAERVWMRGSNELEGYGVGITNLVPSNLAKGGASDLSAIIFGNFRDLKIGQWGGIELLVDPYTSALAGTTRMIINHYVDVLVARPDSFAFIDDVVA